MRKSCLFAILCLISLTLCSTALASKWGMSGEMHAFLRDSGEYVEYTDIRSGYDPVAPAFPFIASNGENSQLTVLRRNAEGELEQVGRYPTAVLQPDAGRAADYWVRDAVNGIELTSMWSKNDEHFIFAWDRDDTVRAANDLILREIKVGELAFTLNSDKQAYTVTDGSVSLVWNVPAIPIAEFHLALMPTSVNEVLKSNEVHALLGEAQAFAQRETVNIGKNKTLAVYAAPSRDAYRGARGKAAVSMKEPFDVLAVEDGWWLVEYDVSHAEKRVGYVQPPKGVDVAIPVIAPITMSVTLNQRVLLTDDPHGSGRGIAILDEGTQAACFGRLNAFWAYAEVMFAGEAMRGFVPLSAIETEADSFYAVVME